MSSFVRVFIGVQARSSSQRFPNKIFEKIGHKTMINHVMDSCLDAARYLNRNTQNNNIRASIALLIPHGDPIKSEFKATNPFDPITIIEGSELDVLSRYMALSRAHNPDFIVRITSDCPLIPHFVITKHIVNAVMNDSDYESNVDERVRTFPDGWDCEVLSRRLLEYCDKNAKDPADREHVTTYARRSVMPGARYGMTIGFLPLLEFLPKLSVDSQEDLERVRKIYDSMQSYYEKASGLFGKPNVRRF